MSGHLKEKIYDYAPAKAQEWFLSQVGRGLLRRRFNGAYQQWMALCEEVQSWPVSQIKAYQDRQVQQVLQRAYDKVPYYRRIMNSLGVTPADIVSVADLQKLPVLKKDDIRMHAREMLASDVNEKDLILGHTSGTTGSPLEFWWDKKVEIATNAMIWRHRGFAGFEFGMPYATLLGRLIVPAWRKRPPFWRFNKPWNQLFLSSFHLHADNLDGYLEAMEKYGVQALEAYPSNAYLLALHLRGRNRFLPLKAVFTSSETLMDIQRQLIEERFQCRVFDYYGQAERVMYSGECEQHQGHHHFPEYGAMEILDDHDNALPAGNLGRLVLTGFANDAMPLIRYEIGDISGFSLEPCPCGRTLPLISDIGTKAEDIVVTPDGRFLSPSVLTHPFKPMNNIACSQIIQEELERIVVRIVRRPGYSEKDTKILKAGFQSRLGPDMQVDIEFVEKLEPGGRGKFRWIISKVPLDFPHEKVKNLYQES